MPARFRLSRADFQRLARNKCARAAGDFFTLAAYTLPEGMKGPRMACVVSKKAAAKAAVRNMIDRRCKSAVLPHMRTSAAQVAYVFQAKKSAADASFSDIKVDLERLLQRANK